MKKIISLVLAVLMLISVMPMGAFAEDSYETKEVTLNADHASEAEASADGYYVGGEWLINQYGELHNLAIRVPENCALEKVTFYLSYNADTNVFCVPKVSGYTSDRVDGFCYSVDIPVSSNVHEIVVRGTTDGSGKAEEETETDLLEPELVIPGSPLPGLPKRKTQRDGYQYVESVKVRYHVHEAASDMEWESDETGHWKTCDCGFEVVLSETHNWEDGACTVCGYTCVHKWTDSICDICGYECPHNQCVNSICTDCGFECKKHSFDSSGKCVICHIAKTEVSNYETKEVTLNMGHPNEDGVSVNSITPNLGWCLEDEFEIVAPEDYVLTRIEFRILYGDRGVPKFCGYTPKGIGVRGWYAVDFPFSDNIHSIKADKFDKYQYITEVKVSYHIHSIPSEAVWESDEANHWTFCSCGEKIGISEHNWAHSEYCDVCGRKINKQCISKKISDFSTLKSAIDSLPNNYLVYFDIKNNIDVTEELEIKASGVELHFTGPATLNVGSNRAFYIDGDNNTLLFENVTIMGKHSFKGDGNAFFVDGNNCTISGVRMAYCGFQAPDTALGNIERVFNSWCGGAIDVDGENCTIKNCSFDRCYSQGDGGAIYIDDEGCVVSNCYMDACFAESDGGAIYVCYEQTNALIIDCKFYGYSQCKSLGKENNVYAWDNATVVNPDPYSKDETLFYNCTVFTKEEYEAIKAAPGKFVSTIAQGLGKAFGFSSTFSKGNGWIVAAVGGAAAAGVAAIIISKKKKKAAVAETAEEAAEETAETEEKEE